MLLLGSRTLTRTLFLVPAIALPIVVAFDAGSVALMQLAVADNTAEAGRAGVTAIAFERQASPQTAQMAFDAAKSVTDSHGEDIDPASFRVHSDGSVTLTVSKSTRTVLFGRLPGLRDLTKTQHTETVRRSNW